MAEDRQIVKKQNDRIKLPDELSIANSVEFYQLLMNLIEEGGDIELDADSLTRIDAAGIQLLFVVQRALSEGGNTLRWFATSPPLKESAALLGMTESLALAGGQSFQD